MSIRTVLELLAATLFVLLLSVEVRAQQTVEIVRDGQIREVCEAQWHGDRIVWVCYPVNQ